MEQKQEFIIKEETDIITARQFARELAKFVGFKMVSCIWIATVVSELARNVLIYAKTGIIIINTSIENDKKYIEIIAQDKGPGIKNLDLAMTDGYSTSRGLGMGLPGSKRLMDNFKVNSQVGEGTTVIARKWL
jgi:serine/threonine-protein kinase RsbT